MANELALVLGFAVGAVLVQLLIRWLMRAEEDWHLTRSELDMMADAIRSEMRSARWAMEAEERSRWVREWSLLTMDPPPGVGVPSTSPGRQSGSNTRLPPDPVPSNFRLSMWPPEPRTIEATFYFTPNEAREWERWLSPAMDPSPSIRPSTPSPSGPRRIGRRPEEMRLSRFLDGGSLESARSD